MQGARGYISHVMRGGRSVPQSIQQQVIRAYCDRMGLAFLLSATEFGDSTIMLESIKEDIIVMYSIFQWPRGWKTSKQIHFAAEKIDHADPDFLETVIFIGDYHEKCEFRDTIAYLQQAQLHRKNDPGKAYEHAGGVPVRS